MREIETIEDVLDWCSDIIEEEENMSEEEIVNSLREIYDFLYINNGGNYYLITYDKFFGLLNKYRDRMGEKYKLKYE